MKRPSETKIDGQYPYDNRAWKKVRNLTSEEAAKLTNLDIKDYEPGSFGHVYMWLNKGYIMISSTQAVYLHDGQYSLIDKSS